MSTKRNVYVCQKVIYISLKSIVKYSITAYNIIIIRPLRGANGVLSYREENRKIQTKIYSACVY